MPPSQKKPTAAEAAAEEAANADITFKFRDVEFVVPRDRINTVQWRLAIASRRNENVLYETLGAENVNRFLAVCKQGEQFADVAAEFFDVFNAAAGWGNS